MILNGGGTAPKGQLKKLKGAAGGGINQGGAVGIKGGKIDCR